jgi:hypothetical protein
MKYQADVWLGSYSGKQKVYVNSNTTQGAREQIKTIYDVSDSDIYNLYPARNNSQSDSISLTGGPALFYIIGGLALWVFLTPWIFMTICGAAGTWVSQKITRTTLEEACDNDNTKAVFIILISSLISGGYGFVQGNAWNKEIHSDNQPKVEQIKPITKNVSN